MSRHRQPIPPYVAYALWGLSAGRCEFRGCNVLVYRDDVSHKRANLGRISHIVAASADGPRGDPVRSPLLCQDIGNLMLTCSKHADLVDKANLVADYPEQLLLEFKREHEERIRMLTAASNQSATQIIVVQIPIDGFSIPLGKEVFHAILPEYSLTENPIRVDLNATRGVDSPEGFSYLSRSLAHQVSSILRDRETNQVTASMSVFALAPIPLLIYLGALFGDINPVKLYQKHRSSQEWSWPDSESLSDWFVVSVPGEDDPIVGDPALIVEVSMLIPASTIANAVGRSVTPYHLRAASPGLDFLRSRKQIELFGLDLRQLLATIRQRHPADQPLHVFAAVPSPIAVEMGRHLRLHVPSARLYEYRKATREYWSALDIEPMMAP